MAVYVVKLACERPDTAGRSLAQWDCAELARQLVRDGVVEAISPQTVRRLAHHKLKPWRHHLWLSPQVPRDAAFAAQVRELVTLYTRPLGGWEMVVCVDEKTSLQPRTRTAPTLAAQPGLPVRVEHTYERKGALNLFAGFDTRTGKVYATTAERKRQAEFIAFLEHLAGDCTGHHHRTCRPRQCEDAQGETGPSMVDETSALCLSFSAPALFLDESSRAVVLNSTTQAAADYGFCG